MLVPPKNLLDLARALGDPGTRWLQPKASRLRPSGTPLPVPATSILSRSGAWRSCLEEAGPKRENVVVESSHCGMGHHVAALVVIADRLAQPEGSWTPFSGWARGLWRAHPLRSG
jgi:hypothetical protein